MLFTFPPLHNINILFCVCVGTTRTVNCNNNNNNINVHVCVSYCCWWLSYILVMCFCMNCELSVCAFDAVTKDYAWIYSAKKMFVTNKKMSKTKCCVTHDSFLHQDASTRCGMTWRRFRYYSGLGVKSKLIKFLKCEGMDWSWMHFKRSSISHKNSTLIMSLTHTHTHTRVNYFYFSSLSRIILNIIATCDVNIVLVTTCLSIYVVHIREKSIRNIIFITTYLSRRHKHRHRLFLCFSW